jgi:hypothetical protein
VARRRRAVKDCGNDGGPHTGLYYAPGRFRPPRQWKRIRGEFGGVHAGDRMSSARAGRALGCGLHYRRMATWQSEDWSSGRCAVPRARRTVALRSGTDSSLPVRIRVRPSSLLAALFPFASGAAFVLRVLVGGGDHDRPRWAGTHLFHRTSQLPSCSSPPASAIGSEPQSVRTPTLRFAPLRCPKPSSASTPAGLQRAHNTRRYEHPFAGGPGPIGPRPSELSRRRELPVYGVLRSWLDGCRSEAISYRSTS